MLERLANDKHSSLLGQFIGYEENQVLYLKPLERQCYKTFYACNAWSPLYKGTPTEIMIMSYS